MKTNLEVNLEGRGTMILRSNDHLASGGEGAIYKASNTVIKIYSDLAKMKKERMAEKIRYLSKIDHPFIVAPKGIVQASSGCKIGFYMDYVKGEPLSRVFTNDFRKRENFTDKDSSVLVDNMKKTVEFAHKKKAILVDANEMNWLTVLQNKKDPEPRVIDVDSWAIDNWPATVIMPSIRDWHSKGFDELSDWFSWGIVTFQIYTGIHPYKGKLAGYKMGDLEKRMKDNASVFSKGVKLNRAVRDFSAIPGRLFDWYFETFQNSERSIPPSPFTIGLAQSPLPKKLHIKNTSTGSLIFDKLFECKGDAVRKIFSSGVLMLTSRKLIDIFSKKEITQGNSYGCEIVRVDKGWLKADKKNNKYIFSFINEIDFSEIKLDLNISVQDLFCYENRLFILTDKGLSELKVNFFGKVILSLGETWGFLPNATKWFDGLGISDVMGAMYVFAPFGENACAQIRVRELDGLKPISAKAGNRFITIIAMDKKGIYQKLELSISKDYRNYKIWQKSTDSPDLNIAILPKGVCATIIDDGSLDIFVPSSGVLNKIQDKFISGEMILGNLDNKVVYIYQGKLWRLKMK